MTVVPFSEILAPVIPVGTQTVQGGRYFRDIISVIGFRSAAVWRDFPRPGVFHRA
jgi:hypothetical protein